MRVRALLVALAIAAVGATTVRAAHAGGSVLHFEREWYEPGELAIGRTSFSPGCCNNAGVDDGPWLLTVQRLAADNSRPVDSPIAVGELVIVRQPSSSPLLAPSWVAIAEFVVPDAPAGGYTVSVRNQQGAWLGDITHGWFHIGPPPPVPEPAPAPSTAAPAPVPAAVTTVPRAAEEARAASALHSSSAPEGGGTDTILLVTIALVAVVATVATWRVLARRPRDTR